MFGFLKNREEKKLEKQYAKVMSDAVNAQRNGDIKLFSELSFQAEELLKKIDGLKKTSEENNK